MIQAKQHGRDLRGRFAPGNRCAEGVNKGKRTGRPPRRYSIATALVLLGAGGLMCRRRAA